MADPLSAAGLALSVASLTFELFSACIKGYNLLLDAKDMPVAYRYLLVRLQMEKDKLIGWAVLAKVSESDESLAPALMLNRQTIHDVFREMQVLLLDVAKLKERYKLELVTAEADTDRSPQDGPPSTTIRRLPESYVQLEKKAVHLFNKTRKCPNRLRWASFDKDRFEQLLSAVAGLNDSMTHFLHSYERGKLYQMQEVTFMQILQVNNRMDDLFKLLQSLKTVRPTSESLVAPVGDERDERRQECFEQRTIRLARFKAINLSIDDNESRKNAEGDRSPIRVLEVPLADLDLTPLEAPAADDYIQRSCGTIKGKPVWLEWRYYQPIFDNGENEPIRPPSSIVKRITNVAKLLCDPEKPAEFHVPECVGYIHDTEECRIGFVFNLNLSTEPALPVSLLQLLNTLRKPSLTARIRIARLISSSIWYLHSTQWLHKGLRSDNIVFPHAPGAELLAPVLCGFDYSRPASLDETTEGPTSNPWHDLYRHPKTQFSVPRESKRGFRKLYDIYSLGVVLFEIGTWQPINKIMGIDAGRNPKATIVKRVQSGLISPERMQILESEAGSVYARAVEFCLSGGSDPTHIKGAQGDDSALQLEFWEKLLTKLDIITV